MIPIIYRTNYKPKMTKSPIRCNVYRSKIGEILPITLHEGTEVEWRQSRTLSLTSILEGNG